MTPRVSAVVAVFCCTAALHAQTKNPYKDVTGDVRLDAIRHAQVWTPVDVAGRNMRLGPQENGFAPEEVVTCEYVEKKQSGTPKFDCEITPDDQIRVKFGKENGEIYSEVAATRLLWALGFGADRVYPVRVVCKGCPDAPMKDEKKTDAVRRVDAAVIERKMRGDEIGDDSGWAWVELTFVDETAGGAPLAHRDALTLLAAMIQHTDNKPEQQRLVCLDRARGLEPQEDGSCRHSLMMIHDVGKTFGKATLTNADENSAVNFEAWSGTPVWKDASGCVAQLSKSFSGSLEHPRISEAGREFLSGLLAKLTDTQLRDMFEVARFTQRDPDHSIEDWIGVFKQKRDEIANTRCTSQPLVTTR